MVRQEQVVIDAVGRDKEPGFAFCKQGQDNGCNGCDSFYLQGGREALQAWSSKANIKSTAKTTREREFQKIPWISFPVGRRCGYIRGRVGRNLSGQ